MSIVVTGSNVTLGPRDISQLAAEFTCNPNAGRVSNLDLRHERQWRDPVRLTNHVVVDTSPPARKR